MKNFLLIFNSLPAIVQSVTAIEAAIPMPQAGKQKLDLVLNAASTAWAASQITQQITQNQMVNSVAALTNLTVATLNVTGVFKNTTAAATPVVATPTPSTPATSTPAPSPVSSK